MYIEIYASSSSKSQQTPSQLENALFDNSEGEVCYSMHFICCCLPFRLEALRLSFISMGRKKKGKEKAVWFCSLYRKKGIVSFNIDFRFFCRLFTCPGSRQNEGTLSIGKLKVNYHFTLFSLEFPHRSINITYITKPLKNTSHSVNSANIYTTIGLVNGTCTATLDINRHQLETL